MWVEVASGTAICASSGYPNLGANQWRGFDRSQSRFHVRGAHSSSRQFRERE
jgi:hypothetical protein